jgi:hypothetical protein
LPRLVEPSGEICSIVVLLSSLPKRAAPPSATAPPRRATIESSAA